MAGQAYTPEDLSAAVAEAIHVENKASINSIARDRGIPPSTLKDAVKRTKLGVALKKPGRKLLLGEAIESDMEDWLRGMQARNHPITPQECIDVATDILCQDNPASQVSRGRYQRFMQRHPDLTTRKAQSLSSSRNKVTIEDVNDLHASLIVALPKVNNNPGRVFNMDETGFTPKRHANRVIAEVGSQNVWSEEAVVNFHMTIVACISASGVVIPPLFILPVASVHPTTFDALSIKNAALASTPSGFMNSELFVQWLDMLNKSTEDVERPVVLVYDGCPSHVTSDIISRACELGIMLFFLPPNSTHLFQPLDVSVFRPLKRQIRIEIRRHQRKYTNQPMSKAEAVKIACATLLDSIPASLCRRSFESTGIFPLCRETMKKRFKNFDNGGRKDGGREVAPWLQQHAREHILVLPAAPPAKPAKRVRIVGILTLEDAKKLPRPKKKTNGRSKKSKGSAKENNLSEYEYTIQL